MYWINFSSIDGDVTRPIVRNRTIVRRRHSGKRAEFTIQMRLVAKAGIESHCGPLHSRAVRQALNHRLKALDAAVQLGRETYRVTKQFDESLGAVTGFLPHLADMRHRWRRRQLPQSVRDGGVRQQRALQARQQRLLEQLEQGLR